ncbi:uncharacterized protein LOC143296632 [Babylonia areolata]|uniref:uncharacterized protein LOC143296632 n=1 Tax=Babylonia areolata TaxID=304850 RepID=UPI003FD4E21B
MATNVKVDRMLAGRQKFKAAGPAPRLSCKCSVPVHRVVVKSHSDADVETWSISDLTLNVKDTYMSTTLSVLHVLMMGGGPVAGGGEGAGGAGHLILPGAGGLPPLDPLLRDFWSSFPCPPPWNHALLFRVNWTACVGRAVGRRLQWFLADRCNIPHDDLDFDLDIDLLPFPGGDRGPGRGEGKGVEGADGEEDGGAGGGGEAGGGELEVPEECEASCVAMIALACLVFSLLLAVLVFCVCRNRSKASSPSHQSALSAYPDNAKYYTSCHYASAPILPRPLETRLRGCQTETRVVKGASSSSSSSPHQQHLSPYHQHSPFHHYHHHRYEQHPLVTPTHTPPRSQHHHHQHCSHHHHHTNQAHFNPVILHTNDSPNNKPGGSAETAKFCGAGGGGGAAAGGAGGGGLDAASGYLSSSSASQTYSDRSHTYESIGDVHCSGSVSSGMDKVSGGIGFRVYAQGHPRPCAKDAGGGCGSVVGGSGGGKLCGNNLHNLHNHNLARLDSCEGVGGGGGGYFAGSSDVPTLPIRPVRHVTEEGSSAGGSPGMEEEEEVEVVEEGCYAGRRQSTVSSGSRRRVSSVSSSHPSEGSAAPGGYLDGVARRSIPALHPNYFDPPESSGATTGPFTS